MLTMTCLLLTLVPADTRERLRPPPPTLRELCIKAPVIVLARPVDPVTPLQFTVLTVLRGKEVKVGQRIALQGLAENEVRSFDEVNLETKKLRPRRIDQAVLFLRPSRATVKGAMDVLPAGFRLCTDDGRVLVPAVALGEDSKTGPRIAARVAWSAVLGRVRADVASVDRLHVLRRLGRPAQRVRGLLDWVEKRRYEFGVTASLRPHDLTPNGWGELGYQIFDWIFESEGLDHCWQAVRVYADVNRGEAPRLTSPVFSSVAGRQFLLQVVSNDKCLLGDRHRALRLLGQPITLWPATSTGRRQVEAVTTREREKLLDQLRLLLTVPSEEFRTALVETLLRLSRSGKDQPPKPSTALINTLAEMYRGASPGGLRDSLARTLWRVAPERYRELSGNPAGVCVCLRDMVQEEGELLFFVDLRTGKEPVFEQPTLVLERPGALGFAAETKRFPLPALNLVGGWTKGVGGEMMLAVRLDLSKVLANPQNARRPGTKPVPPAQWRVRVEGSVGKGTAKQTWKSEVRRITLRPQAPANPGMYPYMGKW